MPGMKQVTIPADATARPVQKRGFDRFISPKGVCPQENDLQGKEEEYKTVDPVFIVWNCSPRHGKKQDAGQDHHHPGNEKNHHVQRKVRLFREKAPVHRTRSFLSP